jgi:hypothetical protein
MSGPYFLGITVLLPQSWLIDLQLFNSSANKNEKKKGVLAEKTNPTILSPKWPCLPGLVAFVTMWQTIKCTVLG